MSEIILHGTPLSGHTHRVALLLAMLGLPHRLAPAPADVRASAAFRALNPLGQVPVIEDGPIVLADSNAILVYLVRRYAPDSHWLPDDPVAAAQVQRWLSIAAGEIMYGPATARLIALWAMPGVPSEAARIAGRLLPFMDAHLDGRQWLATSKPTIADLACYGYVAHAPEGGIDLAPWRNIDAWLRRVEALPGFIAIPPSPIPAAA